MASTTVRRRLLRYDCLFFATRMYTSTSTSFGTYWNGVEGYGCDVIGNTVRRGQRRGTEWQSRDIPMKSGNGFLFKIKGCKANAEIHIKSLLVFCRDGRVLVGQPYNKRSRCVRGS